MSQRSSIVFRVLAAFVLIAVMIGGGYMAFQAGQTQGYALGAATNNSAPSGAVEQYKAPVPYYPGMMGYHHFPFMGFFGFIPLLIGMCLVFGLLRLILWGPRHMHHGPWMYGQRGYHPWYGDYPCGEPGTGHPQGQPEGEKK